MRETQFSKIWLSLFISASLFISGRPVIEPLPYFSQGGQLLSEIPVPATSDTSTAEEQLKKTRARQESTILVISRSSLITDMDISALGEVNLPVRSSSIHSKPRVPAKASNQSSSVTERPGPLGCSVSKTASTLASAMMSNMHQKTAYKERIEKTKKEKKRRDKGLHQKEVQDLGTYPGKTVIHLNSNT